MHRKNSPLLTIIANALRLEIFHLHLYFVLIFMCPLAVNHIVIYLHQPQPIPGLSKSSP